MKRMIQTIALTGLAAFASSFDAQTARADWFNCQPRLVSEFIGSRIHVRCHNTITLSGNVVSYIAVSHSSAHANRFLSMAQAALLSGKTFIADIPASSATNVSGCPASNCRTPTVFAVE